MDSCENNINLAYKHLPTPFREFNESSGKVIYNELLFKPKSDNYSHELDPEEVKSIMILHLADDPKELASFVESNRFFIRQCGHMTVEDQIMIIEILYYHAFTRYEFEEDSEFMHTSQFSLCNLLHEFIVFEQERLNLTLDWRPCFNVILNIISNNKLKGIFMEYQDNSGNYFNLLLDLFYDMK